MSIGQHHQPLRPGQTAQYYCDRAVGIQAADRPIIKIAEQHMALQVKCEIVGSFISMMKNMFYIVRGCD
jgi:hypothetical protein